MRRSGFVSRQSLISAMNGPSAATIGPSSTPRPADVRLLNADIRGSLCTDIASKAEGTDAVLVDLFDERFGVELLGDGTYITRSPERLKHVALTGGPSSLVAFGTEEHFELWRAAADRFVSFLADNGLLPHTYLLDIAWAQTDESGLNAELPFGLTSAEANVAFARYVDHLRNAGVDVVSHTNTWTARGHKWGPSPYNFHDDVYAAVAVKLNLALRAANPRDPRDGTVRRTPEWDERHHAVVAKWDTIEQFDSRHEGRVQHVVAPRSDQRHPLRCLIQNNGSDTLLVISHGALPRAKYSLPRFEWLASLENRGEKLMFLADTALEPYDDLELAWFTGSAKDDLTSRYAELVAQAARQLGATKILFLGGSGGGFASLALAAKTPGSRALVFNPQTNIRNYWAKSVRLYLSRIFPEFDSASQLGTLGSRADLATQGAAEIAANHQIFYVQNDDDAHHVERHLAPFAASRGMEPRTGISADGNIRLIVEHFATGHNMPYRVVLNPFVDLALANWGCALGKDPHSPENAAVSRLWDDPASDLKASAAIAARPQKKLVWLDTIFCDAETDVDILNRYMARFMMTLHTIGQQRVPKDTDIRLVVHLSRDKSELAPKIQAAFDSLTNGMRATSTIHFYEHPAQGYGVPEGSHIDRVKNPNKQPGRRERLFADSSQGLDFGEYAAVVRISMDDDDLFLPGHLDQISSLTDFVLQDTPNTPSAVGMYQCYLAHVGDTDSRMEHVSFNRVIPGNKFFVVPRNQYSSLADFSPWSIPEYIDDEAAEAFLARGIKLTLARNNQPTFVYMRRSLNLSGQSKAPFIDAVHGSRTFANEVDLVSTVAGGNAPRPTTQWQLQPLDRMLRLTCSRIEGAIVRAETNFSRMFGPGHQIAYYLMKDGSRIDTKWYSTDDVVFFDAPAAPCSVRVFVRKDGKIIDRTATRHAV
ncbi:DUF6270 domain-containing protein [Arthrobacter sp. H16F315]|nr:DUF6270 domain-containing protein [Arthrobacter sp. H16F315]MDD1477246.1 DUF6270 domain-containing protein [Arthrobacter sp. H16F315]